MRNSAGWRASLRNHPGATSAPGWQQFERWERSGSIAGFGEEGERAVAETRKGVVQSWPQATAPLEQVFCWAMTPLQFQSKLPQASGMVRNCELSKPGFAPLSRSQQSPE